MLTTVSILQYLTTEDILGVDRLSSAADMQYLPCISCKVMEHVIAFNLSQQLKKNSVLFGSSTVFVL